MTKKKSSKKSEYNATKVRTVHALKKEFGWSIRRISKETGIPKSVVGRWVKEEHTWVRSYDFRDTKRKVKTKMTFEDYKAFKKVEKQILKEPIGGQSSLTVHFIDDDETWEVEYI